MIYPNLYGAFEIARDYCGFSEYPNPTPKTDNLMWQHGVEYDYVITIPEMVVGSSFPSSKTKVLVANKLLSNVIKNKICNPVFAIGLPIIYLPEYSVQRKKDSLLVFPAHGVPGSSMSDKVNLEYARYIQSIAHKFSNVEICIFGPDYDKEAPIRKIFEETKLKIIRGVDDSKNALHIQKKRMLSFSHVTSNVLGSHIPYAAFYGCRVSLAGPTHTFKKEHIENIEFYKLFPKALKIIDKYSEYSLKNYFSWLFCEPHQGVECKEWANIHVGFDCKISPKKMCKLFGWNLNNVFTSKINPIEKIKYLFK